MSELIGKLSELASGLIPVTNEAIIAAVQNKTPTIEDLAAELFVLDIGRLRDTCKVLYESQLIDFDRRTRRFIPYGVVPFAILSVAERFPNLTCEALAKKTRTVNVQGPDWIQWLASRGLLSVDDRGRYSRPPSDQAKR